MRDRGSTFSRSLRKFPADNRGGVGLLFGFALIPLLLAIGSATDYTRATALRARLQAGTDAAALALPKKLGTLDDNGLKDLAQTLIAKQTDDPSTKITAF